MLDICRVGALECLVKDDAETTESLSKDIEELEEQTGIDTDSHNDDESQE